MEFAGYQILAELRGCHLGHAQSLPMLEDAVRTALAQTTIKLVKIQSHQFYPEGITTTAILSTSHLAIHTFPECQAMFFDLFTCDESAQAERMLEFFCQVTMPETVAIRRESRGDRQV